MLVFWKQRLVFLAVPKTGTQAWEAALLPHASMAVLDPPELKHAPLYRYNRFFRPMFDKFGASGMETVAVVREPVAWLSSWYRYRQRPFLDGRPESTAGIDFDRFVEEACSDDPPPRADIGYQSRFVAPRKNGLSVTHLFAYEDQERLRRFFETRLETTLVVPEVNVSGGPVPELSAHVLARLRDRRSADFELWERARQATLSS